MIESTNLHCNKVLNILSSSGETPHDIGDLFDELMIDIVFGEILTSNFSSQVLIVSIVESQLGYQLNALRGANLEYAKAFDE